MMNFLYHKRKNVGSEISTAESDFSHLSISELNDCKTSATISDFNASLHRNNFIDDLENFNWVNLHEVQDKTRSCRKACLIREKRFSKNYHLRPTETTNDVDMNIYLDSECSLFPIFACMPSITVTTSVNLSEDQSEAVFSFFYFKCLLEYTMYRLFKFFFMSTNPHIICIQFKGEKTVNDFNFNQFIMKAGYRISRTIDPKLDSWKIDNNQGSSLNLKSHDKRNWLAISENVKSDAEYQYDSSSEDSWLMDVD